jgi:hypothetical protein
MEPRKTPLGEERNDAGTAFGLHHAPISLSQTLQASAVVSLLSKRDAIGQRCNVQAF